MPGLGLTTSIEIYGRFIEHDVSCNGVLDIYAPYSRRKGSFFYSCENSYYKGIGLVGSNDFYEQANLDTLFRFLHVIGGGGRFTLTARPFKKKIASFTLNENQKAVELMYDCLGSMSK